MSYFPAMFAAPKATFQAWLLHVSQVGAMTVYKLDENGKAVDMASGKIKEVLGCALRDGCPQYRLIRIPRYEYDDGPHPYYFRFAQTRWAELVKALNGKGRPAGYATALMSLYADLDFELPWVGYDSDTHLYFLTEEGKAADQANYPEEAAAASVEPPAAAGGPPANGPAS
jgi:hypothetical protein